MYCFALLLWQETVYVNSVTVEVAKHVFFLYMKT